jgi:hypothetical protein
MLDPLICKGPGLELNALSKQVQANVLEAVGLVADTKFLKGKAVGSV